eukprot:m.31969 g.31969  ORF g.31969 m.31969 type:complete len:548 (-) comp12385_c0_seq1:79-1722(-)
MGRLLWLGAVVVLAASLTVGKPHGRVDVEAVAEHEKAVENAEIVPREPEKHAEGVPDKAAETAHDDPAKHEADVYAAAVEKAQNKPEEHAAEPDTYQGRPPEGEPALTAEDAMLYADQQPPEWEPYGDNEAEGQLRDQDFDEEYKRYLDEMWKEMQENPEIAHDIIESIDRMESEGHMLTDKDQAVQHLAHKFQEKSRSRLEEQEREILNRQRRETRHKLRREEGLGGDRAGEFGFNDPGDQFWHGENVDKKALKKIVENRAKLLHNVDHRRKEAFLQHEMERLLEYRELVQRTTDPHIKEALIAAHNAENQALKAAHGAEPGKEAALKEEWAAEGFDPDSFDPKTMFRLADTNGDDVLDEKEVEALVHRQAERIHHRDHGEAVDMMAIAEEAARMREHALELMDTDHDQLITFEEFMHASKSKSFKEDAGWNAIIPENEIKEKLEEFEQHRKEVLRTGHKQADPNMLSVADHAVRALAKARKTMDKLKLPHPLKKNPFGKLVDKLGGVKTGWGKIAKTFGEPHNITAKKPSAAPSKSHKIKVVKDT